MPDPKELVSSLKPRVKPDGCQCRYPKDIYRTGSGHKKTCPIHIQWTINLKQKLSKKRK